DLETALAQRLPARLVADLFREARTLTALAWILLLLAKTREHQRELAPLRGAIGADLAPCRVDAAERESELARLVVERLVRVLDARVHARPRIAVLARLLELRLRVLFLDLPARSIGRRARLHVHASHRVARVACRREVVLPERLQPR